MTDAAAPRTPVRHADRLSASGSGPRTARNRTLSVWTGKRRVWTGKRQKAAATSLSVSGYVGFANASA